MRQRRTRNLEEKMAALERFTSEQPEKNKGRWHEILGKEEIYLEIGCGKGKFITSRAKAEADAAFIGFEGQKTVVLKAMEKADSEGLTNVLFIPKYMEDPEDIFEPGEISGIYLNFSDPWPKAKHEKRRLTCTDRLKQYGKLLAPGSLLEFKTDNDELFEYSLTKMRNSSDFEVVSMTRDLHGVFLEDREDSVEAKDLSPAGGDLPAAVEGDVNAVMRSALFTTEYEDRFSGRGKNINFVRIVRR